MRKYYYNQIYKKITSNPIVIYGMGDNGIYTYNLLKEMDIEIECFVDKDEEKCKKGYGNIKCIKLDELEEKDKKNIIVTPLAVDDNFIEQLKGYSFRNIIAWLEVITLRQMRCHNEEIPEYLADNIKYKGIYKGKRCFVIGNGPSLKEQNILSLKDEIVFTVNNVMKLEEFKELKPKFHVYNDRLFFDTSGDETEINERVELMKSIGKETVCFVSYTKSDGFMEKYNLHKYLNVSYIDEDVNLGLNYNSMDFQKKVAYAGSVVIVAVLLALYMGFSEIYLLGCDCTDIFSLLDAKLGRDKQMEYAFKLNKKEELHLKNTIKERSFEVIYGGQYAKFKNFRVLNKLCQRMNVKLYDCTKGGLLDCVEKKELEEVLS